MKSKLVFCMFMLISPLLIGCSKLPPLDSGFVVSKRHVPEKVWFEYELFSDGELAWEVPVERSRPARWIFVIQGRVYVGDKPVLRQRVVRVSMDDYIKTSLGDVYTLKTRDRLRMHDW